MVQKRRYVIPFEVILYITIAPMHGPKLVPHGWTLRGVLVNHQLIYNSSFYPIAPRKRGVA
jgi:hypothetical protein